MKCFDSFNNRNFFLSSTYTSNNLSTAFLKLVINKFAPSPGFFEWLKAIHRLFSADSVVYFGKRVNVVNCWVKKRIVTVVRILVLFFLFS